MIYKALDNWTIPRVLDKIKSVFYSCKTDEQVCVADIYAKLLINAYTKQHGISKSSQQYCLLEDWAFTCRYQHIEDI